MFSRSVLSSSLHVLLSVLLCGLIHWWRSGWRAVGFCWRSSLGGILVLAVVGLGLVGVAALAVADAALLSASDENKLPQSYMYIMYGKLMYSCM